MPRAEPIRLHRPVRGRRLLGLTPLVDVMLILLIFFMVTSSYLNLRMIPIADRAEAAGAAGSPGGAEGGAGRTLLIRVEADGRAAFRGRVLTFDALTAEVAEARIKRPDLRVLLLPSARAPLQGLVDTLQAARLGGAAVAIVRPEGA